MGWLTNFDDKPKPNLQAVADIVAQQVNEANQDSIEQMRQHNRAENKRLHGCDCGQAKCYISCPRYLTHYASHAEFWGWWASTAPPNNREREVHPPGEPSFKGGSKKGRARKKKPPKSWFTNPFLD